MVFKGKALGGLLQFGREVIDLQQRAHHSSGADPARQLLLDRLKDIRNE